MEKRLLGLGEEPRQQTISREISRGMEVEELAHTLFHSSLHLFENTHLFLSVSMCITFTVIWTLSFTLSIND